jgi:hypothetical protein
MTNEDSIGFAEAELPSALNRFSRRQYTQPPAYELRDVASFTSAEAFAPSIELSPDATGNGRFHGTKLATLVISASTFVVWIVLMMTVVADSGNLPLVALITAIPFVAHVASMCLAARGTSTPN